MEEASKPMSESEQPVARRISVPHKESPARKAEKSVTPAAQEPAAIVFPPHQGAVRLLLPRTQECASVTLAVNGISEVYSLERFHDQPLPAFELLSSNRKPGVASLAIVGNTPGTVGFNLVAQWILEGEITHYITQDKKLEQTAVETVWIDPLLGRQIPISAVTPMRFSVCYGLHRCSGQVHLTFLTRDQKPAGQLRLSLDPGKVGGPRLADYARLEHEFIAPGNAAFVQISIIRSVTDRGDVDSYLFFARLSLRYQGTTPEGADEKPASDDMRRATAALMAAGAVEASVPLPRLPAGVAATIVVRWGIEQAEAIGSPLTLPAHEVVSGEIAGVQATTLYGSVDQAIHSHADPTLYIYLDGTFVASARPDAGDSAASPFVVNLPATAFDGRVHLLSVQGNHGETIAEAAMVLPFCTTPWDALQKYAESPLPASLAPLAGLRAESLRGRLQQLSQAPADSATALQQAIAQLHAAHEIVLEGPLAKDRPRRPALQFPHSSSPRVSIVIPAHQQWEVTRHCLASLLLAPNRTSYEVILVDDSPTRDGGSADRVEGITILRQKIPRGYIRGCNAGAEKARGEYLAFLKPTSEVTAWWLDELVDSFERFDQVGIVGAKLIDDSGRLQFGGGVVQASGASIRCGQDQNAHDPRYSYTRQVDYVSGAAMVLPTALWKKIGGFSPEFAEEGADVDLAFKAMAAGSKALYAPQSVVVINDAVSLRGLPRQQEAFRGKLREKWAPLLDRFASDSSDPEQSRSRRPGRKALVIDYAVPRPNNDAGSYAAVQEMRLLTALGYDVTLAPESFAYNGADTERLLRMGVQVLHAPFVLSIRQILESRGREFDLVYVTRYYVAQKYIDLIREHAPQAKLAFCNADLHFLREMRDAFLVNTPDAFARAENTRREELAVCEKVDLILTYSDVELAVLASYGIPPVKTALCPWIVETPEAVPSFQTRAGIAFIGGFEHRPNGVAVRHFVSEVMPLIHASHPEITFHVFGSDSTEKLADLDQPGVVIEGRVDDTAMVYDRCRVFVAPLLTGAGLKGKVVGAFARGTPTVLSPVAVEATGAVNGRDCLVAESPAAWAAAIIDLYTNESRWTSVSLSSQSLARARYSFEQGQQLMGTALQKLGLSGESLLKL